MPNSPQRAQATLLEERRLTVLEQRVELDLLLGRHASLIGELRSHVQANPLRERLWAQLMLALHGVDRQAEALAAYRELRRTLVDQLGIEPTATLQQLERAILSGDGALEEYLRERRGSVPPLLPQPPLQPAPPPAMRRPTTTPAAQQSPRPAPPALRRPA